MVTALYGLLTIMLSFMSMMFMTSSAVHILSQGQALRDGDTLVSSGGNFELGFFNPGSSLRKYVGIWFKNVSAKPVVWVANREIPLLDSSGVLQIANKSVLILASGKGDILWSTNSSRSVQKPIAQLLDSGNLVIRDENDENPDNFLWQSFDYPCDTELPGMKLGKDLVTGFERFLTSWKHSDDPSPGSYTYRVDLHGYPQPFLYKDSVLQFREGPWNGEWFSEAAQSPVAVPETYQVTFNDKAIYYSYELVKTSVIAYRYLSPNGTLQCLELSNLTQEWSTLYKIPNGKCDTYGICGAYATCNAADSPQCQCMKGFVPKSPKDWNAGYWADGCVRSSNSLNLSIHNEFLKISNAKVPDTRNSWYNTTMTLYECSQKCLSNSTCVAYANLDVTGDGIGCLLWFGDLNDVKVISGFGQNLYLRMLSSYRGDWKTRVWIAVSVTLSAVTVIFLCGGVALIKWKRRRQRVKTEEGKFSISKCTKGQWERPVYALNVIAHATNDFSHRNKLGEGGYGPVYKGVLSDGQEIAVKRLSKESRQGLEEFKNEILSITKLQHKNLVKLLGSCVDADERMLIYEYMSNKSLDSFIFDNQSSSELLDWPKRLDIIKGIADGLVYLHENSKLKIVHRDLKASNVLLDSEMNPKISDFGLAKTFYGVEDEGRTKRVIGTYGYMPPEYAFDGLFSVKSDVYSFGVLVLEIVSGQKNRGFNHEDHHHNLLGHTWILFKEGVPLDVVDPSIKNASHAFEMKRAIHIGLLCVQQHPDKRPSMPQVTVMLCSDRELPEPKEPGFYVPREFVSIKNTTFSNNEMTISNLYPIR